MAKWHESHIIVFYIAKILTEFDKNWCDYFRKYSCMRISQKSSLLSRLQSRHCRSFCNDVRTHDERTVCVSVCMCVSVCVRVLDECHLPIDRVAQRAIVSPVNGALLHSRLGSCSSDDSNSLEPTVRLRPTSAIYEGWDIDNILYPQSTGEPFDLTNNRSVMLVRTRWTCENSLFSLVSKDLCRLIL